MFDDMKTKGALKKINEGGTAELSRSQIVLSLVNLNAVFKPLKRDDFKKMPKEDKKRMNAIIDWYKDLRSEKTKETYDKAKLDEVSSKILAELKELQGPSEEELAAEAAARAAQDEDVKQAEKIDLDNFFDSDDQDEEEESDDTEEDEDGADGSDENAEEEEDR